MVNSTKTSKTEWEISQLVRTRLFPDEGDKRHPEAVLRSASRALFEARPEVRRQYGDSRLHGWRDQHRQKAAEMMGISHEEMKEILTEGGAEIHLAPRTVDEVLRDAENA